MINDRNDFIKKLEKANITNLKALLRNSKKVKQKLVEYSTKTLQFITATSKTDSFLVQSLINLSFMMNNDL